jgi:tetratricopeptide (TPR) repeat protein
MADTPKAQGRQFGFHGREKEFAWLRGMFDAVATKDADGKYTGPRMAVIVAESGIGKSRLVQELYIRLTSDPKWDPPEFDYWPEAFGDDGTKLRENPEMEGHQAGGPPRFLWLGARWSDPNDRNAVQSAALPNIASALKTHAEIFDRQRSAWASLASRATETVRRELGEELAAEVVGRAMQAAVEQSFLAGLVLKLGKSAFKFAKDRREGPRSFEQVEEHQERTLVDELVDSFRLTLGASDSVPVVLWLDDAQWADKEARRFLASLWRKAKEHRWPLLIVATHWEREWRQSAQGRREKPETDELYGYASEPGVEVRILDYAETAALRAFVAERLPGLKAVQQSLLVEKAGGNFRQMAENVGELVSRPRNFEGSDGRAPLSAGGENLVRGWKLDRSERVRQRFDDLGKEFGEGVQDLLGWSSQLGTRFLHDVAVTVAREIGRRDDAPRLLDQCVDPLAVLGQVGVHTREFRDRAFHAVAEGYFNDYLAGQRELLSAVLRRHLADWVNNSFDAEGNEIWPDIDKGVAAPERSATGLSQEERRDLLGMAMRELPLPERPDWTNPEHVAALRAVALLVAADWLEDLWSRVEELCRSLAAVPFDSMPRSVISVGGLELLGGAARTSGAYHAAQHIAEAALAERRRLTTELDTPARLRAVSVNLHQLACIEYLRGDLAGAEARFSESISLWRRIAEGDGSPDSLVNLADALSNLGLILDTGGDFEGAQVRYSESIEISRRLEDRTGTLEHRGGLARTLLNQGKLRRTRDDFEGAEAMFSESVEVLRRVAEDAATPENLGTLAVALSNLGLTLGERGDLASAESSLSESIEISRRLAADIGTPEQFNSLAVGLLNLGNLLQTSGELTRAASSYSESIDVSRRLTERGGTPAQLWYLAMAMRGLGKVHEVLGDLVGAESSYSESIEILRRAVRDGGTPGQLETLAIALSNLGDVRGARGDWSEALKHHEESLGLWRRLVECFNVPTPRPIFDFIGSLGRCRDIAISVRDFARADVHARELWGDNFSKAAPGDLPRIKEVFLSHACPALLCELELGRLDDAAGSAIGIEGLVETLIAAFDDPSIDREEEELDSTTLFRCAEGLALITRLRAAQGDAKAEKEARTRAIELRARAEALKAEENAGASAADEESDEDNPRP